MSTKDYSGQAAIVVDTAVNKWTVSIAVAQETGMSIQSVVSHFVSLPLVICAI